MGAKQKLAKLLTPRSNTGRIEVPQAGTNGRKAPQVWSGTRRPEVRILSPRPSSFASFESVTSLSVYPEFRPHPWLLKNC